MYISLILEFLEHKLYNLIVLKTHFFFRIILFIIQNQKTLK